MNVALPRSLNVDAISWLGPSASEQGKYELIDGVVIMQQSQTWGHAKVKTRVFSAFGARQSTTRNLLLLCGTPMD